MHKELTIALLFSILACGEKNKSVDPLPHYDLAKPEKFTLPAVLREISGIAFSNSNNDTIYAEQDEEGRLFHFKWDDKRILSSKFGRKGDYEDIAILNSTVIMLRSDGMLVTFPISGANEKDVQAAQEWNNLLPPGEYEAVYADPRSGMIHVLCKHCAGDNAEQQVSGYLFTVLSGQIKAAGNFALNTKGIAAESGEKKIKFRPSAMARSTRTGDWYILSSINSMIVIADEKWTVKQVVRLDRGVFNQPEGMAFDAKGNLYISNEGGAGAGNILKFTYRQ